MSTKVYKGKDTITGYYVYGDLMLTYDKTFISDPEAGLVSVYPDSVIEVSEDDISYKNKEFRTAKLSGVH